MRPLPARALVIYVRETYLHEIRYESYKLNMLRNIAFAFAGKGSEMPPSYMELTEEMKRRNENKVPITSRNLKERYLMLRDG